jgi:hypothetical protein
MVGVAFIAVSWTGRPFVELEYRYGIELLIHVFLTSIIFLLSSLLVKKLRWPTIVIQGEKTELFQKALRYSMLGLGVLGVLVFGVYLSMLKTIPIISVLKGSTSQLANALLRSSATNGFEGDYWRFNSAISYIIPFVSWFFLISYIKYKKKFDLQMFLSFFFIASFAAVVSIQKAPIIIYLGLTYLVYLVARGKRFSLKNILYILAVSLVIIPGMYILFMNVKDQGILTPLQFALNRAFVGQIYPGLYYLAAIPENIDFLNGTSLPNPGGLLWHTSVNHAQVIWRFFFPDLALKGMQGTMNTIYIMDGYANFGYLGMYLVACISGVLVMAISRLLQSITMDELRIPLIFLFSKELMKLGMTSFSQVFVNFSMYLFIILLFIAILSVPVISRFRVAVTRLKE